MSKSRCVHIFCGVRPGAFGKGYWLLSLRNRHYPENHLIYQHQSSICPNRQYHESTNISTPKSKASGVEDEKNQSSRPDPDEPSPLRQRIEELEEQSMLDNPRRYIKEHLQEALEASTSAEQDAHIEMLKARLANKIEAAKFQNENAAAISYTNLSDIAGKEIRDTAISRPWTGTEPLEDLVLRGLHESKPRLRSTGVVGQSRPNPPSLAPSRKLSKNERLIAARDGAGTYSVFKKDESELNEDEREARSRMFRERFEPAGRAMPNTVQGLTNLANEKIEEAIARGLFKNLPKGKPIEQDYHASSPFIDTTEFILNRMIQRQEIAPPWIEKQQELKKEIRAFRGRLRAEWKRHVIRTIASWGGGPEEWIRRAEGYAFAERIVNPDPQSKTESNETTSSNWKMDGTVVSVGEHIPQDLDKVLIDGDSAKPTDSIELPKSMENDTHPSAGSQLKLEKATDGGDNLTPVPFRDSNWEKNELSYHTAAIKTLNEMTRSYNLQAPRIAQRPFLTVARERLTCYREVMPTITAEMVERANNPNYGKVGPNEWATGLQDGKGHDEDQGFFADLLSNENQRVYDESESKAYGFKQFMRDLFTRSR